MRRLGKLTEGTCALAAALLLFSSGCRELGLFEANPGLAVEPAALRFDPAWAGHTTQAPLFLRNTSRAPVDVRLETTAPFAAPAAVRVPGGETLEVNVAVTPAAAGRIEGTLTVRWLDAEQAVSLTALVQAPPGCEARACRSTVFDATRGGCVETPLPDGSDCSASNACLVDAACRGGECVGRARDCDDGNACTADACAPATGCVHDDVSSQCPDASEPCRAPVCDPRSGCGLVDALDGTACGPNDCSTAQVCMAGACVTRTSPEGSTCAAATLCQGAGVCRDQQCEVPAPTPLTPVWTVTAAPGHRLTYGGHVDDDGHLYATDHYLMTDGVRDAWVTDLVSYTRDGLERWRTHVVSDCTSCGYGLAPVLDTASRRLFVNAQGRTHALSTDDGSELWTVDASAGLPVFNPKPDGTGAFYTSPGVLLGGDRVGVPVSEGYEDHHAYVRVLDRATGRELWQLHRKGHMYGLGASGNGELWVSSANCWAPAGDMERVDAAGTQHGFRFIQGIPAVYGADFGIGTSNAQLQRIDGTMATHGLGTSPGYYAPMLVTGSRLVTWGGSSRALVALDTDGGDELWRFDGLAASPVDFELVRDGGVAWTASVTDGGFVGAVDGAGQKLFECPLSTTVESPTAIFRGRAFVETADGIAAYDVPGLDVETTGWVSAKGSLSRGSRAR